MSYRYIGNKTKLLPWLMERIGALVPSNGRVADLMCGTASVSEALRTNGYTVIASDVMTFAVHHARTRLLLDRAPEFSAAAGSYDRALATLNGLAPVHGYYWREYSPDGKPSAGVPPRKYLSAVNAAKLDAIDLQLGSWQRDGKLTELEHSLLRHDLVLAVNRVANIAGTYGHFRSTWSASAQAQLWLRASTFNSTGSTQHIVLQGRAEDVAGNISADAIYLDPPYMKRQYAANYHLIETVARGDHPEAIGVSGLRPWRDQYSNFCTKTKIFDSFRRVICSARCDLFFVSYSGDGLISEDALIRFFDALGEVSLIRKHHPRFKSNAAGAGNCVEEFLITLKTRHPHTARPASRGQDATTSSTSDRRSPLSVCSPSSS